IRLSAPKLGTLPRPVRIVQLSDLHCDLTPRLEPRLPALVAAEHPDAIVFSGDSLNAAAALPPFRALLRQLADIAPTYVVRGNWDAWFWGGLDLFGGTGAVELNGSAAELPGTQGRLWIAGVGVESEAAIPQALGRVPAGAFTLFLYHY